jgi:hypothetical protein
MRLVNALLPAALVLLPLGTVAQDTPVVLELYTSQGCSSCPPADALLAELAAEDGVIALALHVDYWDYLGWKDSFARSAHTARQRAYAKAAGRRTIYTPEMIVQGERRIKGHDAEKVAGAIDSHRRLPAQATVTLTRDGDALEVHLAPAGPGAGPSEVYLVRFIPSEEVSIEAGENAGEDIVYTNIVTDWESIGRWDGAAPAELRYEGLGEGPVAVIVQRTDMGPVLTAAELR